MSFLFPRVALAPVRCSPARHEIASVFSLFDETFTQLEEASRPNRRPFNPRFDIKEAKDSYFLEGELPGFDPKNISIEFVDDGHTLQIKGRTQSQTESGNHSQAIDTQKKPAVEDGTVTPASGGSVKSHQATVEDEEPANASAVVPEATQEVATPAPQQPTNAEKQASEYKHWVTERYTGEFTRSFKFPSRVNQDTVRASLKDGILSVTLPFAQKPASRRINIE